MSSTNPVSSAARPRVADAETKNKKEANGITKRVSDAGLRATTQLKKEHATPRKSCSSRLWTVAKWIFFPFTWLFSKIRNCWREVFSDPDATNEPEDDSPIDITIPPPPSTRAVNDPPKKTDSDKKGAVSATQMKQLKESVKQLEKEIKAFRSRDFGKFATIEQRINNAKEVLAKQSEELSKQRKSLENAQKEGGKSNDALEKRVSQLTSDIDEVSKALKLHEEEWQKKLASSKDEACNAFQKVQKDLKERLSSEQALKKDPIKQSDLTQFHQYLANFEQLKKLGWVNDTDTGHIELIALKSKLKEVQGFANIGNTCWKNAALQAIFGAPVIREKILGDIDRQFVETESDWKKRKAELEANPPMQRPVEGAAFAKRLAEVQEKYPIKRTAKIQKMLLSTWQALAKQGLVPEGKLKEAEIQKLASEESDRDFEARAKKNSFSTRGTQSEDDFKAYQKRLVAQFQVKHGIKKASGGYQIEPRPAQTDDEFKAEQEKFEASLERRLESEEDFEKRKKVHSALQELFKAWNEGEVTEDHLESFRKELTDSQINNAEFSTGTRNMQSDSAAFVVAILGALGLSIEMVQMKKMQNEADWKAMDATNPGAIAVSLLGEGSDKIKHAQELIENAFAERANDNPEDKWRGSANYEQSYRLDRIPDVLPIHFHRKVTLNTSNAPAVINRLEKGLKELIDKEFKSASEDNAKEAIEEFKKKLLAPRNIKVDRSIEFPANKVLNLGAIFSKEAKEAAGLGEDDEVDYLIKSFTVHSGSYNGGHYIAYRLGEDGVWRCYNDTVVTVVNEKVLNEALGQAYNLFLERVV